MAKKSITFKGTPKPFGKSGHFNESRRHSLQARGIKTGNYSKPFPIGRCVKDFRWQTTKEQKKEGWYNPAPVLIMDDGNKIFPSIDDEGNDGGKLFGVEKRETTYVCPNKKMPDRHFDWRTTDTDGDGVADHKDCDPLDPTKQDYELSTQYDSRKSFYGKANVRREDDKLILRSYNTDVAYIKDGKAVVKGTYSVTTLRHIKEFLKQNGFRADNSDQILEDYSPSKEQIKEETKESMDSLKTIGTIAKMGDIFTDTKKEKNEWKARMLKAGLGNKGFHFPDDWDTLSEDEKEKRLDAVIEVMGKN